jgi:hypothetical protein
MPAPEEYRCAACGGDLRIGHDTPCVKCGHLWEPNELDSRGLCAVCDGQLGLQHAEHRPDPRSAYRLPPLSRSGMQAMLEQHARGDE